MYSCILHVQVIDTSGQASEFEDTAQVEKYEMSNTDYAQRTGEMCALCMCVCVCALRM